MPSGPASPNIPAIVTTDLSSKLSLVDVRPPSPNPPQNLLSPHPVPPSSSAHRPSVDLSRSPSPSLSVVSSNDAASVGPPPSPTLSTQSSVHFATSIALRDNKPDERCGVSSLQLLSPSAIDSTAHRRKTSFTSSYDDRSSIDETVADHSSGAFNLSPIRRPKSDATSLTLACHTHSDSDSPKLRNHPSDDISPLPSSQTRHDTHSQVQDASPPQDPPLDLGPFPFHPDRLASLLDPKDLDALQALGGIDGVLRGLGTHPSHGLLLDPAGRPSHVTPGAGEGASERHGPHVRESSPPPPDGPLRRSSTAGDSTASDPHNASLADRKAIYGENILPHRQTTSLLGLMWLALKDKVLVRQYSAFASCISSYSLLGLIIYSCGGVIGSRIVPGFWHASSCWPPTRRLGRRRCHHHRDSHRCRSSLVSFAPLRHSNSRLSLVR